MYELQPNATLQGGKYRIEKVLGQGGFGITYLAENTMLDGKVAIKEFYFRDYCNRDKQTSHIIVPTESNRKFVERYKHKFIKEARTIFKLNHPNIIKIHDIFEENNTAYYVMDYIEGESLADMMNRCDTIPEDEAIGYIKEVANALSYIHGKKINHLDVKPGNIMRRSENGRILLIDFGVAKQYDTQTHKGETTTPVGVSLGYSPTEQYLRSGVQSFSPQSDVYALAATLYKLLTGITPPEAMEVLEKGLPTEDLRLHGVSQKVIDALLSAMRSKSQRTQTIEAFISDCVSTVAIDDEATVMIPEKQKTEEERKRKEAEEAQVAKEKAEAERRTREKAEKEKRAKEEAEHKTQEKAQQKRKIKRFSIVASLFLIVLIVLLCKPVFSYEDDAKKEDTTTIVVAPDTTIEETPQAPPAAQPSTSAQTTTTASVSETISKHSTEEGTDTYTTHAQQARSHITDLHVANGVYSGETLNGKPHGRGILTFSCDAVISTYDGNATSAHAGESVEGFFEHGIFYRGTYHSQSGDIKLNFGSRDN